MDLKISSSPRHYMNLSFCADPVSNSGAKVMGRGGEKKKKKWSLDSIPLDKYCMLSQALSDFLGN